MRSKSKLSDNIAISESVIRVVKRVLPSPLHPFARKVYNRIHLQVKPSITRFHDDSGRVLQCCIAYNKYGGFCIPLSSYHRHAAQKILSGGIYEPKTIEFLISHAKDGDIVHAGTYFGDFLPALSQSRTHNAKVWAFEPNPENYRCALITSHINGLHNVEITNAALGEIRDTLTMITSDADGQALGGASKLAQENDINSERKEIVQIVTIDEVIPSDRKVSIIQLDVEGYEKQALRGAIKTIQRCLPIIVIETLPDDNWLTNNLLCLGYQISQKIHNNTILICDRKTN